MPLSSSGMAGLSRLGLAAIKHSVRSGRQAQQRSVSNYGHCTTVMAAPPIYRISLAYKLIVGGGMWVVMNIYPMYVCMNVTRYKRIAAGLEEKRWYD